MKSILVIDDEPKVRNTYCKLLEEEGYRAFGVSSADEATEVLLYEPMDLVLLDINMPGVDGIFMRAVIDEFGGDVKVLVTSVYPISDQFRMIPDALCYFDKSYGTDMLLQKVRKLLSEDMAST